MTIGKLRALLYRTARILGDVNAVRRGTVKKRIASRITGRIASRLLGLLFR